MIDILKIAEQMRNHALELIESITSQQTAKPNTFEAHGKTWTRHTPGDPMPCEKEARVCVIYDPDDRFGGYLPARCFDWLNGSGYTPIIGWRYADDEKPKFSEPWAKEKEAHAAGKMIQYFSDKAGRWMDVEPPKWYASDEYRVKPEPKFVKLGRDDVPPSSQFRLIAPCNTPWVTPFSVTHSGVYFPCDEGSPATLRTWEHLKEKAEINRSIPLTGKWDANAWEPCHKEESAQ